MTHERDEKFHYDLHISLLFLRLRQKHFQHFDKQAKDEKTFLCVALLHFNVLLTALDSSIGEEISFETENNSAPLTTHKNRVGKLIKHDSKHLLLASIDSMMFKNRERMEIVQWKFDGGGGEGCCGGSSNLQLTTTSMNFFTGKITIYRARGLTVVPIRMEGFPLSEMNDDLVRMLTAL